MKDFTSLFLALDSTNKTNAKIAALVHYFDQAPPRDAAWAVTYLTGKRPKSPVNSSQLKEWITHEANIPEWLFTECYDAVGDLAETVSLLLPAGGGNGGDFTLAQWVEEKILPLRELPEQERREQVVGWWRILDQPSRFVLTKLLTGGWRLGVSQKLVARALAELFQVDQDVITHRLMGQWQPDDQFYEKLGSSNTDDADLSRPYPFFLAYPFDENPQSLGALEDWQVEWKYDGIRAQVIKRSGQVHIWTRGGELVTPRFPEVETGAHALPDGTVLDGELLGFTRLSREGELLPFSQLQRRIGRKSVGRKLLSEVPVGLMAFDLLEFAGNDLRDMSQRERRQHLESLFFVQDDEQAIMLAPLVEVKDWQSLSELREESRIRMVEGFILKDRNSLYGVGRKRGPWWKWKVDPYAVDAVLLYAQRGSGKRASLYTDYTFGVWDGEQLVPFAKAYSGLSDAEIREVDRFVRRNTVEKFGPVRSVPPELVMELHFEGISLSTRHKSGIAVRFPRIARWRRDKPPAEADSLETIKALLPATQRNHA